MTYELSSEPVPVKCISCSYSLEATPRNSVCPECGTRVMESAPRGLLVQRPSIVAEQIRKGLGLIKISILLGIGVGVLSKIVEVIFQSSGSYTPLILSILLLLLGSAAGFLSIYGGWLATNANSEDKFPPIGGGLRSGFRLIVVLQLILHACSLPLSLVILFSASSIVTQTESGGSFGILAIASLLLLIVMLTSYAHAIAYFFVSMLYMKSVALLAGDTDLAKRVKGNMTSIALWVFPGVLLLGVGLLIAIVKYYKRISETQMAIQRSQSRRLSPA